MFLHINIMTKIDDYLPLAYNFMSYSLHVKQMITFEKMQDFFTRPKNTLLFA